MKLMWRKKYTWILLTLAAIIGIAAGFFTPADEAGHEFWWSHIYGFFILFGLIGCAVLVIVAKLLGRYWLQRKENYYD